MIYGEQTGSDFMAMIIKSSGIRKAFSGTNEDMNHKYNLYACIKSLPSKQILTALQL